jgi:hypothetical protein
MVNGNKISGHTENSFLSRPVFQGSGAKEVPDCRFQNILFRRKSSHGRRNIDENGCSGPTEEELRQVKMERKRKWKREAEYSRLLEESSLARRYKEKINVKKYPHGSLTARGGACQTAERQEGGCLGDGQ